MPLGPVGLVVGALPVLRPGSSSATTLVVPGALLSAAGVLLAFVDLLGVPPELHRELFVGFWISLVGTILSCTGWLLGRRRVRATATGG